MVDRYTKLVLTIIAVSLVIIAAKDLPLLAAAQEPTQKAAAQEPTHVVVDEFNSQAFAYAFRNVHEPLLVRVQP